VGSNVRKRFRGSAVQRAGVWTGQNSVVPFRATLAVMSSVHRVIRWCIRSPPKVTCRDDDSASAGPPADGFGGAAGHGDCRVMLLGQRQAQRDVPDQWF